MPHVKGNMFVIRGFELPVTPRRFTLQLCDTEYRVHSVLSQGNNSKLVIEYALPGERTRDIQFEAIADDTPYSNMPYEFRYLGTYETPRGGVMHVYGPRGVIDPEIPRLRPLM